MKTSHRFNLIEILISMVVIIFAMFILMSFIPLAQKKAQSSINIAQISSFNDHLNYYLKHELTWSELISQHSTTKFDNSTNKSDYLKLHTGALSTELYEVNQTAIHKNKNNNKGVYRIVSFSIINDKVITEAEVEARVWLLPSEAFFSTKGTTELQTDTPLYLATQTDSSIDDASSSITAQKVNNQSGTLNFTDVTNRSLRIMIEYSWPINKTYSKRSTKTVFIDHMALQ